MQFIKLRKILEVSALLGLGLCTTACATQNQQDPYENFNRGTYQFNKNLDRTLIKPVAIFYKKLLPPPVTKGVSNFFCNLSNIPTVVNDALQGCGHYVARDTTRFVINSTVGIGGLFDVACHVGLPNHSEDFGLTLAKWGYTNSNYLILPILGPSTVRDTIGIPVDYYGFSVYPYISPFWLRASLISLDYIDQRSQLLAFEGVMKEASLDEYTFERNAYLQHRAARIAANKACGDPSKVAEKDNGIADNNYIPGGDEGNTGAADDNYVPGGEETTTVKTTVITKESGSAKDNYVPGGK